MKLKILSTVFVLLFSIELFPQKMGDAYALNINNGSLIWKFESQKRTGFSTAVLLVAGNIYTELTFGLDGISTNILSIVKDISILLSQCP